MATQMGPLVFLLVLWFTAVSLAVQCTYKNTYSRVTIDCDSGCCALVINRDDYKKEDVCCSPFINIVARWAGSSHDSTILSNSELGRELETGIVVDIGVVMTSSPPAVTTNAYYAAPPQYNQVVSNNTGPANPHVNPAYDNKV
ncbi:uncharacterized protein LOC121369189 isoform X3 [Gigantopelta aegis]|uniref:uncharacterized protein LOC121369189 isoform X3 n=1 Tax=Gigantopelta aegis TaxID=1735272 RepID=UPI001B8890BD|nr:uncharacterized protein LOC121369189 isoform X3 [Gigantopelta aegis]